MAGLSDLLPASMQVGSTILSGSSQLVRGQTAKTIATRRKGLADYEAQQLDQEGAQASGLGLRVAQDEALKTALVNSAALARAASSGSGASDPTIVRLLARTAEEGAYRQSVAMYEGEAQARLDRMKGEALRYEGNAGVGGAKSAANVANMGAASTFLSGGAKAMTMYDKYWSGPTASEDF